MRVSVTTRLAAEKLGRLVLGYFSALVYAAVHTGLQIVRCEQAFILSTVNAARVITRAVASDPMVSINALF